MYIDDEGIDYSENYVDKIWRKELKREIAKIDFLLENLPFKSPKILDITGRWLLHCWAVKEL